MKKLEFIETHIHQSPDKPGIQLTTCLNFTSLEMATPQAILLGIAKGIKEYIVTQKNDILLANINNEAIKQATELAAKEIVKRLNIDQITRLVTIEVAKQTAKNIRHLGRRR